MPASVLAHRFSRALSPITKSRRAAAQPVTGQFTISATDLVRGTVNYKCKNESNFPAVRIEESYPDGIVTKEWLEGRD